MSSKYKKYVQMARKYSLCILEEEVIEPEFQKNIDFNDLFNNMTEKKGFTVQNHVNRYIIENIKDEYKNNYFFQYCIFLLSDYYYENKKQFTSCLEKAYKCLKNTDTLKLDEIMNYLKCNNKTIPNINEKKQTEEFCYKVNQFFSNYKILNFIADKFNNIDLLDNLECDNYFFGQSYETNFLKALILLNGNIDIKDMLKKINSSNDILLYCLEKIKCKLKIKIETEKNKVKLLNYINKVYIKNGYFFHGTTSQSIVYIKKNDLTSQFNNKSKQYIVNVNKIFEQHNIYRMFEGKINELKTFNFYVTDDPFSAIYYANQSPEFLSRFCANGGNMLDTSVYDRNAFWRRDYDSCKRNINTFMNKNNFSRDEISIVNECFHKLWQLNVSNKQYPILFIGKRKHINRNYTLKYEIIRQNINNYSFEEILDFMLVPDNIHDKQLSKIGYEFLSLIKLPNIYQLYKIKGVSTNQKFLIYNNTKIFPDIIISAPFQKKLFIKITDKDEIEYYKNIVFIPNNIDLLNQTINDNFYFQNIDILLTDSGIGLTSNGIELIIKLQKKYSIEYLVEFYKHKINHLLNRKIDKVDELFILVDNYYIRHITMKKYDNYYVNISSDKIDIEHFKVDDYNYMYKYKQTKLIQTESINKIISSVKKEFIKGDK